MKLLLLASVLLLLVIDSKAETENYINANGIVFIPNPIQNPNEYCSKASFYENDESKKLVIYQGDWKILKDSDGTNVVTANTTSGNFECNKDSDEGYMHYADVINETQKHEIGLFNFVKPSRLGKQKAILTTIPWKKANFDSPAIMWKNDNTGTWSGVDFINPKLPGVKRFWWDSVTTNSAPSPDLFDVLGDCDQPLPQGYVTPPADCQDFMGDKKFNFGAKSFVATGKLFSQSDDDDMKVKEMNVRISVDVNSKKMSIVAEKDGNHFGFWSTVTSAYRFKDGKCVQVKEMAYDNMIKSHSSPYMIWAGQAKVERFGDDTSMASMDLDIYLGSIGKNGLPSKLAPTIYLINNDGMIKSITLIRGYSKSLRMDKLIFDQVEMKTPERNLLEPSEQCLANLQSDTSGTPGVTSSLLMTLISALIACIKLKLY